MHLLKVGDHVKIRHPNEYADLLQRVRRVRFDIVWVVDVQLHVLHIPHVVHDLELLHQVVSHAVLDLVSTSQVPPHSALKDHYISFDHQEEVTVDLHSEMSLDDGSGQRKVMDLSANKQTSQPFLDFLG